MFKVNTARMNINPTNTPVSGNKVSVLLVCPPGLEQASLYTSINAIPYATVIAKAADVTSALQIAQQQTPDVLLVDANFLQDEAIHLLWRIKEVRPEMIRVVLAVAQIQKRRLQQNGADFILDYDNLNQRFPQILSNVQAK